MVTQDLWDTWAVHFTSSTQRTEPPRLSNTRCRYWRLQMPRLRPRTPFSHLSKKLRSDSKRAYGQRTTCGDIHGPFGLQPPSMPTSWRNVSAPSIRLGPFSTHDLRTNSFCCAWETFSRGGYNWD